MSNGLSIPIVESKSMISSSFLHAGKNLCYKPTNALTVPLVAGTEHHFPSDTEGRLINDK